MSQAHLPSVTNKKKIPRNNNPDISWSFPRSQDLYAEVRAERASDVTPEKVNMHRAADRPASVSIVFVVAFLRVFSPVPFVFNPASQESLYYAAN